MRTEEEINNELTKLQTDFNKFMKTCLSYKNHYVDEYETQIKTLIWVLGISESL